MTSLARVQLTRSHQSTSDTAHSADSIPVSFLDSRIGRPWDDDQGGHAYEFYTGEGASQLGFAVVELASAETLIN